MKSAEEIAVKIMTLFNESDRKTLTVVEVINLLGEFAEARVKEAHKTDECATCVSAYKIGREQALEEAAKLSGEFVMSDGDHGTEIAMDVGSRNSKRAWIWRQDRRSDFR